MAALAIKSNPSVTGLKETVAILVLSCDRYADLWDHFFRSFRMFWPDCPFRVYLQSNDLCPKFANVQNVCVGDDRSWSDSLAKALSQLRHEYIFLHLDDHFPYKKIDTEKILRLFSWAVTSGASYLRVNPSPEPDEPVNQEIGRIARGAIYRTSTVLSLWNRKTLLSLLEPHESAWVFEVYGSARSDRCDGFYARRETTIPLLNWYNIG